MDIKMNDINEMEKNTDKEMNNNNENDKKQIILVLLVSMGRTKMRIRTMMNHLIQELL